MELATSSELDAIVVESTGISEPIHVAETFQYGPNLPGAKTFSKLLRLDTMVTVVDAPSFFVHFQSSQGATQATSIATPSSATTCVSTEEDQPSKSRTLTDLLIDQIQFADIILLNKSDVVSRGVLEDVQAVVRDLNPLSEIIVTDHGKIDMAKVINTGKCTNVTLKPSRKLYVILR
jgi:G3E family GTPase